MAYIIKLPCYLGLCTILSLGCAANVRLLRANVEEFKMEAQNLENREMLVIVFIPMYQSVSFISRKQSRWLKKLITADKSSSNHYKGGLIKNIN